MKTIPQLVLVSSLLLAPSVYAEQAATPAQTQTYGYIGLAVDVVSEALKAHYPEGVSEKQGLLVTRFADRSPAADDGIKTYDILIAYDDQPIEDPAKFIEKVRQDKPNRVAKFKLIRQGELLTVPVTIGEQKVDPSKPMSAQNTKPQAPVVSQPKAPQVQVPQQMPTQYQYPTAANMATAPRQAPTTAQMPSMAAIPQQNPSIPNMTPSQLKTPPPANFNGLAIRKVAEGVYEASIGFIGADGKPQRRAYRGSHIQILQQVRATNDLSPQAKQQLLFALRPPKNKTNGWGGMPFNNNNMMPNPKNFFKGWGW